MLELQPIRSADDRRAALVLLNQAVPWAALSQSWIDASVARPSRWLWGCFVVSDGERVGVALVEDSFDDADALVVPLKLGVLPAIRRQGVGSLLAAEMRRHLPLGRLFLTTWVDADDGGAAQFACGLGFELGEPETARFECRVSAAACPPGPFEIRDLASLEDDQRRELHSLIQPALEEIPGPTASLQEYSDWTAAQRRALDAGAVLLVAVEDGHPIGLTGAERVPGTSYGFTDLTLTAPPHRGKGVALALKTALHVRATRAGFTALLTEVHHTNGPMLAVNRRLGYHARQRRWATLRLTSG